MADKDNVDGKYPSSKPKGTLSLKGGAKRKKSAYSVSPGSIDGQRERAPKSMSETMGGNYGKIKKVQHMLDTMEMAGGKRQELYDIIAHLEEDDYVDEISNSGLGDTGLTAMASSNYGGDDAVEEETYQGMSEYGETDTSNILSQRVMSMSYGVQAATLGIIDGSYSPAGKDKIELTAAIEDFTKSLGGSTAEFVRAVKSQLPSGVKPTRSKQDVNLTLSMMGSSAEDYIKAGGTRLDGQTMSAEAEIVQRDQQEKLYNRIESLADTYYLTDATKASDIYGVRKAQVVQGLAKHFMDGDISGLGMRGNSALPLPNQLGIPGLKWTKSVGYDRVGSAFTPLEHAQEVERVKGKGGPVTLKEQWELINRGPSAMNTFSPYDESLSRFGKTSEEIRAIQKRTFDTINDDALELRDLLRSQTATIADGNNGFRSRVIGQWNPNGDQAAATEFRNFHSAQLGMTGLNEWSGNDDSETREVYNPAQGMTVEGLSKIMQRPDFIASQLYTGAPMHQGGSRKGQGSDGMYGAKGMSEQEEAVQSDMARYQELIEASGFKMSSDDAIARVMEERDPTATKPVLSTDGYSAYDYYKRNVAGSVTPAQGSDEWKSQRTGNVTGSVAKKLLQKNGHVAMAVEVASGVLGLGGFTGNAASKQGNDFEDKVRDTFLASPEGKDIHWEEAFYESHKDNSRFGATPDGRLFHKDGSSAGLAEFKFFGDKHMSIGKARLEKEINPQVQWQMYVSGERETRVTWLNSETNKYIHSVIKADPELQNKMAATARASIKIADELHSASEVQKMRLKYGGAKQASAGGGGQDKEFVPSDVEAEVPMAAFVAGDDVSYGEDVSDVGPGGPKAQAARAEKAKLLEEEIAKPKAGSPEAIKADKEAADAAKKSAAALNALASTVKKTGVVMEQLGNLVKKATDSVLDEDRSARLNAMDTGEQRGIARAMADANVSESAISQTLSQAGSIQAQLGMDPNNAPNNLMAMNKGLRGPGATPEMRAIKLPSTDNYLRMGTKERMAQAMDAINSVGSREEKQRVANAMMFPQLATANNLTGDMIREANNDLVDSRVDDAQDTGRGLAKLDQVKKDILEQGSQVGEEAGFLAGGASDLGGFLQTPAGGLATAKTLGGAAAAAGTVKAAAIAAGTTTMGVITAPVTGIAVTGAAASYAAYKASEANPLARGTSDFIGQGIDQVASFFGSDDAAKRIEDMKIFREQQAFPSTKISGPAVLEDRYYGVGGKPTIENMDITLTQNNDDISAQIKLDGETYQGDNKVRTR